MGKIKIVYLTGFWYSGATIIGRSLTSSDKVIYVGEIRDYWVKGFKLNKECSCGKNFLDCSFWKNVTDEYINSFPSIDIQKVTELITKFEHWTNYFKLKKFLKNREDQSYQKFLDTYLEHTERLYEIILKHSGKEILVDSSRIPVRLLALSQSKKVDLYPIYVIRDPRGVVNSLIKKDIRNYGEKRNSAFSHAIKWTAKNLLSLDVMNKLNTGNKIYLRYKNFTEDPAAVLNRLKEILNCEVYYEIDNDKVSVNLNLGHVFTGNRSRNQSGKITIIEDSKWKKELNPFNKFLVSLTSVPVLKYIVGRYSLK